MHNRGEALLGQEENGRGREESRELAQFLSSRLACWRNSLDWMTAKL